MNHVDHVHTAAIRQLANQGDWTGLIRYFAGYSCDEALTEAIRVVERRAAAGAATGWVGRLLKRPFSREPGWHHLACFLSNSKTRLDNVPQKELYVGLSDEEGLVVTLIAMLPRAMACQWVTEAPAALKRQFIETGIAGALAVLNVAHQLRDVPITALATYLLARGYHEDKKLDLAKSTYEAALDLYTRLARENPQVFERCLAITKKYSDGLR